MITDISKSFYAIILSAGSSDRMAYPKMCLKFNNESSFAQHLSLEFIKFGCKKVILVVSKKGEKLLLESKTIFPPEVKIVINQHPEYGKFFSLKTGIKECNEATAVFVTNVDNPYANTNILEKLGAENGNADYIYPSHNGKGGHPFMISTKLYLTILSNSEINCDLKEFLNKQSKKVIPVNDESILTNINSQDDYLNWFNL